MIVLALVMGLPETAAYLRMMLMAALVVHLVPATLLILEVRPAAIHGHGPTLRRLAAVALLGGVMLPVALLAIPESPVLAAAILVFAGSFLARWLLVRLPHAAHS